MCEVCKKLVRNLQEVHKKFANVYKKLERSVQDVQDVQDAQDVQDV